MNQKSAGTVFVLALVGGYVGLHRFYLGQIGWGVVYLLTFGLFGVGWVLDILRARALADHVNLQQVQRALLVRGASL